MCDVQTYRYGLSKHDAIDGYHILTRNYLHIHGITGGRYLEK